MDLSNLAAAGILVQAVHVLSDDRGLHVLFETGDGMVCGVRLRHGDRLKYRLQELGVAVGTSLTPTYTNANRMAFIYQKFGTADLTSNPDQAAAVQIALWNLALNNHNPTSFKQDGSVYDSGDPSVFSVSSFSTGSTDTAIIVNLVNEYLGASTSIDPPNGVLLTQTTNSNGQSLLVLTYTYNFGNFTPPPSQSQDPGGC